MKTQVRILPSPLRGLVAQRQSVIPLKLTVVFKCRYWVQDT